MKRFRQTMITLLSVLALLFAAPVVAQDGETERTNPDADLISPQGGLTITGEILEVRGDEQLVLSTESGAKHIRLTEDTAGLVGLDAGDRVAVDYNRTSQGVMIATQIRPFEAGVTESRVTRVSDEPTDLEVEVEESFREGREEVRDEVADIGNELENLDDEIEEELEGTDSDVDTRERTTVAELPATGSNLPLIALIGLVALGGAIGLRAFRL